MKRLLLWPLLVSLAISGCGPRTTPPTPAVDSGLKTDLAEAKRQIADLQLRNQKFETTNAEMKGLLTGHQKAIDTLQTICTKDASQETLASIKRANEALIAALGKIDKLAECPPTTAVSSTSPPKGLDQEPTLPSPPPPDTTTPGPSDETVALETPNSETQNGDRELLLTGMAAICTTMSAGICSIGIAALAAKLGIGGDEVRTEVQKRMRNLGDQYLDQTLSLNGPFGHRVQFTPRSLIRLHDQLQTLKTYPPDKITDQVLGGVLVDEFNGSRFPSEQIQRLVLYAAAGSLPPQIVKRLEQAPPLSGRP